ncbi:MAG: hypothetical protein KF773_12420 [Deltaproteobacteria bacterium]|nr:hypothetical protein [Deltaproteobacteria bacterium]
MSELAFSATGESFELPAAVAAWRVRRLKPRGAPELVYGANGQPLTIGLDAGVEELREAVGGVSGRYRLDPINDDGRPVEGVPAAYIQVNKPHRNEGGALTASSTSTGVSDDTLREAMRLNTDLAKAVIDRFGDMMTTAKAAIEREPLMLEAAAGFLKGADDTRIFDRSRLPVTDDDQDDIRQSENAKSESMLTTVLVDAFASVVERHGPRLVQALMQTLAGKGLSLSSAFDWHQAHEEGLRERQSAHAASAVETEPPADKPRREPRSEAKAARREPESPKPDPMTHLIAIQAALAPDEAARARRLASELAPPEKAAWMNQLATLTVEEAVAKVRAAIGVSKDGAA